MFTGEYRCGRHLNISSDNDYIKLFRKEVDLSECKELVSFKCGENTDSKLFNVNAAQTEVAFFKGNVGTINILK